MTDLLPRYPRLENLVIEHEWYGGDDCESESLIPLFKALTESESGRARYPNFKSLKITQLDVDEQALVLFSRQRQAWWVESHGKADHDAIVTATPCVTLRGCQMLPDIENAEC